MGGIGKTWLATRLAEQIQDSVSSGYLVQSETAIPLILLRRLQRFHR